MTRKKTKKIFALFLVILISMSNVNVSGLFKYSGDEPSLQETKDYIIENIDSSYSNYDEDIDFEEVATLTIKNTYINHEVIMNSGESMDNYFETVHNNEFLDGYVLTTVSTVPLYHMDEDSKYVVGIINTDEQSEVFDVVFAENNDKGIILDDEYYDYDSGLAYISIFDLYKEENEILYTDCVQAQLLRSYDAGNESEVKINLSCEGEVETSTVSEDIATPEIRIPFDNNSNCIDNIYINGNSEPVKDDEYSIRNNELVINTSAGSVRTVDIDVSEDRSIFGTNILKPVTAFALSTDSDAITDMFGIYKKEAHVGDYVDFKATGTNAWSATGINYVQTVAGSATDHTSLYNYMVNHYGSSAEDYVTGWYDGGRYKNIYRSTYNACYGIKMSTQDVTSYNSEYLKKWLSNITEEIQMGCIEVSTAAFQDMAIDDYLDYTAMITAVGDNYVAVSFCSTQKTSRGQSNQVMCGTYAIKYQPEPDTINISYKLQSGYWPNKNHIETETVKVSDSRNVQYLSIKDEPKREGYAFIGWTTKKNNSDNVAEYDIGKRIKEANSTSNITLYAVWKKAHNQEFVYTNYGSGNVYLYEDSANFELAHIKVAKHHYFKFIGYYTSDGVKITDQYGNIVCKNYKNLLENGAFTNIEDAKLYAHFTDP